MRAVVDTNVILVANGAHAAVSEDCRQACVERLLLLVRGGRTVIDSGNQILEEYLRRTEPRKGQRPGDAFLKWLLNNQSNPKRVERVAITRAGANSYAEFDALDLPVQVDPADRKFIAVAAAARGRPPLWQASDSKWLDWWPDLGDVGTHVEFVCPEDIVRFYRRKFPRRRAPILP